MPEKDSNAWRAAYDALAQIFPWISTLMLSILATAAQYAAKVRAGEPFAWRSVALDAVICVFVGLLTHMICEWQGVDGMGRSVLVAISAHMGTRAMLLYERFRDRVLGLGEQ
jgi:hypothetical protein